MIVYTAIVTTTSTKVTDDINIIITAILLLWL